MPNERCTLSRWQLLKQRLDNLTPDAFRRAMEGEPRPHLLDVRTPGEWGAGCLPGAERLDYLGQGFLDRLDALDPRQTYLVYCRSGRRSVRVCTLMRNAGFDRVYNLDGGLLAWQAHFGSPPGAGA